MKLKLVLAILAVAAVATPEMAFAAEAGEDLKKDILGLITGDIGFLVGLGISLFGLYMWLIQQASWGIILLVAGGLVTVFPNIFAGIQDGASTAFEESQVKTTASE